MPEPLLEIEDLRVYYRTVRGESRAVDGLDLVVNRGEILGLRWQDVDWERSILHVRQAVVTLNGAPVIQPPKSRSACRPVPVLPSVM